MRNLFALVGAGTLTFIGLGWYLDWYHLIRQPASAGTQRLQVDLNSDKINGDVKKGIERGEEIIDKLREDKGTSDPQTPPGQSQQNGPASQFFSSPSASAPSAGSGWKSLDSSPPPPVDRATSPASLGPPQR
jgi:hypothetical protein